MIVNPGSELILSTATAREIEIKMEQALGVPILSNGQVFDL